MRKQTIKSTFLDEAVDYLATPGSILMQFVHETIPRFSLTFETAANNVIDQYYFQGLIMYLILFAIIGTLFLITFIVKCIVNWRKKKKVKTCPKKLRCLRINLTCLTFLSLISSVAVLLGYMLFHYMWRKFQLEYIGPGHDIVTQTLNEINTWFNGKEDFGGMVIYFLEQSKEDSEGIEIIEKSYRPAIMYTMSLLESAKNWSGAAPLIFHEIMFLVGTSIIFLGVLVCTFALFAVLCRIVKLTLLVNKLIVITVLLWWLMILLLVFSTLIFSDACVSWTHFLFYHMPCDLRLSWCGNNFFNSLIPILECAYLCKGCNTAVGSNYQKFILAHNYLNYIATRPRDPREPNEAGKFGEMLKNPAYDKIQSRDYYDINTFVKTVLGTLNCSFYKENFKMEKILKSYCPCAVLLLAIMLIGMVLTTFLLTISYLICSRIGKFMNYTNKCEQKKKKIKKPKTKKKPEKKKEKPKTEKKSEKKEEKLKEVITEAPSAVSGKTDVKEKVEEKVKEKDKVEMSATTQGGAGDEIPPCDCPVVADDIARHRVQRRGRSFGIKHSFSMELSAPRRRR